MPRNTTVVQDKRIIKLDRQGRLTPKQIAEKLQLSSVWVVYKARERRKNRAKLGQIRQRAYN